MKRLASLLFLIGPACFAQTLESGNSNPTESQIDQRILDQIAAPITSRAALDGYVRRLPPESPLLKLPADLRKEFLDSLVFTERGLASYRYVPLQKIDMADAYRILALFGVQASISVAPAMSITSNESAMIKAAAGLSPQPIDYGDYACVSKATCRRDTGAICIGSSC